MLQDCATTNFDFHAHRLLMDLYFLLCGKIYSFHNASFYFILILFMHQASKAKKSRHSLLAMRVLEKYHDQVTSKDELFFK